MNRPAVARRTATYDDLLAVPDRLVAEILDGELQTSPRPTPRHAHATTGLAGDLSGPFDRGRGGPGGWWILAGPELHFGDDVAVPDLAGWRRARLPELPSEAFFTLAPDWVCETLSPSTERIDRGTKLALYAREGVAHIWLVNPISETLEAYRLEHGRWLLVVTHAGDVGRADRAVRGRGTRTVAAVGPIRARLIDPWHRPGGRASHSRMGRPRRQAQTR
jgi:Uma2 family endonuclease